MKLIAKRVQFIELTLNLGEFRTCKRSDLVARRAAPVAHAEDSRKLVESEAYRNGSLHNYVENYVRNPLVQSYESLPRPA